MHIPDGFISPKIYIPAWVISGGLWAYSFSRIKKVLNEETLPFISVLAAFSFILMIIVVPLPGGTTAHALGIGPLSILFGPLISFLSISLVLLIQALFFGNGGITTFPINSLAIGFIGSLIVYFIYRISGNYKKIGIFAGCIIAVLTSSFLIAIVLGIQPIIGRDSTGKPLYFPFGLNITIPALMIPHIFISIAEAVITVLALNVIKKFDRQKLFERKI